MKGSLRYKGDYSMSCKRFVLAVFLCISLLIGAPVRAYDALLDYCLTPYQPVQIIVLTMEDGVFFGAFRGVNGELIQAYVHPENDIEFYVNEHLTNCAFPKDLGNLSSITLYPLGGSQWSWSVQDTFGNWHVVKDHGQTVITPPEYDDAGRLITRLVINRNEPIDPARWHIFDEVGNLAG
jgi:hypothetical protein